MAVGDFNSDSHLDIVVANSESDNVSVLLGNGNGSFANQTRYSTVSLPQSVAAGDFNNDSRLDIVIANVGSDCVSVLLGNGDDSFANQRSYSTDSSHVITKRTLDAHRCVFVANASVLTRSDRKES